MKTIFALATILAVGALVSYALPTQVFADESETDTEQRLAQKNVGSGESTNFNCGENSIGGGFIDAQLCGQADIELSRGPPCPVGVACEVLRLD
jgi:hypothetical protein